MALWFADLRARDVTEHRTVTTHRANSFLGWRGRARQVTINLDEMAADDGLVLSG